MYLFSSSLPMCCDDRTEFKDSFLIYTIPGCYDRSELREISVLFCFV